VAHKTHGKIHKVVIDPAQGLADADADEIALAVGIPQSAVAQGRAVFKALYKCFEETDASLAEINPLVLTGKNEVIVLDAKLNFDDNALFRHPEIAALRDLDEEDPLEVEASKHELNYISLDVNIFGGIMKCDTIATGVVAAAREVQLALPLVVRMKGTNEELGKKILRDSGLPIISADNMAEAAKKVVAAVKKLKKKPAKKKVVAKRKKAKKGKKVKPKKKK
jgi:succinyl-CoA synthetase beta subunit